jgi:hypothetical protein
VTASKRKARWGYVLFLAIGAAVVAALTFNDREAEIAPAPVGTERLEAKVDSVLARDQLPDTAVILPGSLDAVALEPLASGQDRIREQHAEIIARLDELERLVRGLEAQER